MRPLTVDDLLPLDEYAGRRREFFASLGRYLDHYRRVRIGPCLTLLFENRQTLWFRVQELLRVARLAEPAAVERELNLYNRLLPGRDRLQGALLIDIADETRLRDELAEWQTLRGDGMLLRIGDVRFAAELVTCRPEDRCIGAAHWVQFTVPPADRPLLSDMRLSAYVEVTHGSYRHTSAPLSDDVRQSLLEDLQLSDRD
jgi:hypothetical protein